MAISELICRSEAPWWTTARRHRPVQSAKIRPGEGPGLRDDRRSGDRQAPARARRPDLLLLLAAVARASSKPRPNEYLAGGGRGGQSRRRRTPSTPARCTPRSSRSGPATARSAAWRSSPRRVTRATRGRAPRYLDMTPALLDQRRRWPGRCCSGSWATTCSGSGEPCDPAPAGALAPARARDAGRALGRLADLRALLGVVPSSRSPNMWTLIGIGVGAAYLLQRRRDARARHLPGRLSRARRRGRRLLRGRRGDRRPGPARPGAGDPRARAHQRRDQGAARPRAEDRAPGARRRRRRGGAARGGRGRRPAARAAGRARSRSTAWCSKAAARSTNRC